MSSSYGNIPLPSDVQHGRGYGVAQSGVNDFATQSPVSPISQSMPQRPTSFSDEPSYADSSVVGDGDLNRSASTASTAVSRSNTLKKKASIRRTGSLKRSSSKKSLRAGSIRGIGGADSDKDFNNAFHTPIPTQGAPTEILANRFQAWRQLLKSLITYFREIQNSYEQRAKSIHKVQNTISNIVHPVVFISENGLGDATRILEDFHKRSIQESDKSREIENDVIGALTGLRSDLGQKIKEIKSLSGDFKNSVEKEKENMRREVDKLQEALQHADHEDGAATGKNDPFVVRLGVDRALEKQIDEENYLHRAYLNLESSGRELESIVVGEIQKAYNAFAGILKREGDDAYHVVEALRTGPVSIPKDQEWREFVINDPHFVDPNVPLRRIEEIDYPGKNHPAATEVRSGMLERKSKYLKSYTAGWYVLSPTHLHEFKSADKIYSQPPVMSLYLLDQKLGSKSEPGSSSHKFMLKGKQSGGMHKGHNWVFRAETHDTMLAWFEAIRVLTEETGETRDAFVRKHARSVSGTSERGTVSSDGFEEDEADAVPYSADAASLAEQNPNQRPQRPQPGGRFPSDLRVPQHSGPISPVSDDSDLDVIVAAGTLPGSQEHEHSDNPYRLEGVPSHTRGFSGYTDGGFTTATGASDTPTPAPASLPRETVNDPVQTQTYALPTTASQSVNQQQPSSITSAAPAAAAPQAQQRSFLGDGPAEQPAGLHHNSSYDDWMAPTAAGIAGVGAGALGAEAHRHHQIQSPDETAPITEETASAVEPTPISAPHPAPSPNSVVAYEGTKVLVAQPSGMPATTSEAVDTPTTTASTGTALSGDVRQHPESTLGGNEAEGAHATGHFFPRVVRHDTSLSISKLHVPGEYRSG